LNALRAALSRGDLALPGSRMLLGSELQPGSRMLHGSEMQPGSRMLHSSELQPGSRMLHGSELQPGSRMLHGSETGPGSSMLHAAADPAPAGKVVPVSGTAAAFERQREVEWPRAEQPDFAAVRERAPAGGSAAAQLETRLSGGGEPGGFLQIARTYLVRALPDGFEIIDQHALHERVTYEGLKRELARGAVELQRLLVPELVEVSRAELELLRPHFDALARVGIELQAFGEALVAVHGLPALLQRPRPELIVRDLIALLEEAGRTPRTEELLEASLQRAACRSSVMAGDALSESEARALLARGAELENDQTCVHGRPTRVRFTLGELERAFQRR
jgi:DNA mismatch repair protein MutL